MAERLYAHTADPAVNCLLPNGEVLTAGSTVRIDLDGLPEWKAVCKWVRRGWLTPVDECDVAPLPDEDNVGEPDNDDIPQLTMTDRDWLESHTVRELREMCTDLGISYNGLRKADLIDAILGA